MTRRLLFLSVLSLAGLLAAPAPTPAALLVSSQSSNQVLRFNETTGAFEGVFASGGGLGDPSFLVFTPDVAAVPEPASAVLLGLGAAGLMARRLRRRA